MMNHLYIKENLKMEIKMEQEKYIIMDIFFLKENLKMENVMEKEKNMINMVN